MHSHSSSFLSTAFSLSFMLQPCHPSLRLVDKVWRAFARENLSIKEKTLLQWFPIPEILLPHGLMLDGWGIYSRDRNAFSLPLVLLSFFLMDQWPAGRLNAIHRDLFLCRGLIHRPLQRIRSPGLWSYPLYTTEEHVCQSLLFYSEINSVSTNDWQHASVV